MQNVFIGITVIPVSWVNQRKDVDRLENLLLPFTVRYTIRAGKTDTFSTILIKDDNEKENKNRIGNTFVSHISRNRAHLVLPGANYGLGENRCE